MRRRARLPHDEPRRLRRRAVTLGVGALVLTATLGALFGDRGFLEVRRYQDQRRQLESDVRRLEKEVRQLHREILALRRDPQAMERIAREELILARPGEVLFLYPRPDRDEEEPVEVPPEEPEGSLAPAASDRLD